VVKQLKIGTSKPGNGFFGKSKIGKEKLAEGKLN